MINLSNLLYYLPSFAPKPVDERCALEADLLRASLLLGRAPTVTELFLNRMNLESLGDQAGYVYLSAKELDPKGPGDAWLSALWGCPLLLPRPEDEPFLNLREQKEKIRNQIGGPPIESAQIMDKEVAALFTPFLPITAGIQIQGEQLTADARYLALSLLNWGRAHEGRDFTWFEYKRRAVLGILGYVIEEILPEAPLLALLRHDDSLDLFCKITEPLRAQSKALALFFICTKELLPREIFRARMNDWKWPKDTRKQYPFEGRLRSRLDFAQGFGSLLYVHGRTANTNPWYELATDLTEIGTYADSCHRSFTLEAEMAKLRAGTIGR